MQISGGGTRGAASAGSVDEKPLRAAIRGLRRNVPTDGKVTPLGEGIGPHCGGLGYTGRGSGVPHVEGDGPHVILRDHANENAGEQPRCAREVVIGRIKARTCGHDAEGQDEAHDDVAQPNGEDHSHEAHSTGLGRQVVGVHGVDALAVRLWIHGWSDGDNYFGLAGRGAALRKAKEAHQAFRA